MVFALNPVPDIHRPVRVVHCSVPVRNTIQVVTGEYGSIHVSQIDLEIPVFIKAK